MLDDFLGAHFTCLPTLLINCLIQAALTTNDLTYWWPVILLTSALSLSTLVPRQYTWAQVTILVPWAQVMILVPWLGIITWAHGTGIVRDNFGSISPSAVYETKWQFQQFWVYEIWFRFHELKWLIWWHQRCLLVAKWDCCFNQVQSCDFTHHPVPEWSIKWLISW
jgi:hypothetical protein